MNQKKWWKVGSLIMSVIIVLLAVVTFYFAFTDGDPVQEVKGWVMFIFSYQLAMGARLGMRND
jgi:hypothetical protein